VLPGEKDHCYTPFKRGYKAASLHLFGESFSCCQIIKGIEQEVVVMREVMWWPDQIDADLRYAMSDVDWDIQLQ